MSNVSKKTPLYELHKSLGGRMVDFAGWSLPIQYEGILAEHRATRQAGGLFDVSHMGRFYLSGPDALSVIDFLTCNRVAHLTQGKACYNMLMNIQGGVEDDIIVYCEEPSQKYILCVNAANRDKVFSLIQEASQGKDLILEDNTELSAQIALQGPKSFQLLEQVTGSDCADLKPFNFRYISYQGKKLLFAATGYTGERGGEIFCPTSVASSLWGELVEKGAVLGVKPVGLGARDGLRLEMGYPLYGHELTHAHTPYESSLSWVVKLDQKEFLGREALLSHQPEKKVVGLSLEQGGVMRQGMEVLSLEGELVGHVTSGGASPFVPVCSIAMAFVDIGFAESESFKVRLRSKELVVKRVKLPFYKREEA